MNEYLDILQWHRNHKTGKSSPQRLGYAKKLDNGNIALTFKALPIPVKNNFDEYTIECTVTPPRDRDAPAPAPASEPASGGDIPF